VGRIGRLRKGDTFDTVYREGAVIGGPLLVLRVRANGLEETRWGFAVGKRLEKRAVGRNRLRRRLREAARLTEHPKGVDIVVTARAGSLEASFATLLLALKRGLERAGRQGQGSGT